MPTAKLPPIRKWPNDSITLAGGGRPGVALQQHDPRGGDVQRQAQQGGEQQHGRERGEVERPHRVAATIITISAKRDVEGEQQIEQERRQRQDHHRQDHDDEERRHQRLANGVARWARRAEIAVQFVPSKGSACRQAAAGRARAGTSSAGNGRRHRRA